MISVTKYIRIQSPSTVICDEIIKYDLYFSICMSLRVSDGLRWMMYEALRGAVR